MDRLDAAGEAVQPLFITVDPEKDTPAQLKAHVGLFHPRMIGLTGSAKQIRKVANDFKVYFAPKRTDPRIDHTGFTFLERFPFFVNRGDSQRGANKILSLALPLIRGGHITALQQEEFSNMAALPTRLQALSRHKRKPRAMACGASRCPH